MGTSRRTILKALTGLLVTQNSRAGIADSGLKTKMAVGNSIFFVTPAYRQRYWN